MFAVDYVDAGVAEADPGLAGGRPGRGQPLQLQHLGTAEPMDEDGLRGHGLDLRR